MRFFSVLLSLFCLAFSLEAAKTVKLCSDNPIGDDWFERVNQQLAPFDVFLERIDLTSYVSEEKAPKDPIIFYNCWWKALPLLTYRSLQDRLTLFLWEPPTVYPHLYKPEMLNKFTRVYTWDDHLVDNQHCFKFYYPCLQGMIHDVIPFAGKKLCTQVSANKHSSHPNELYSKREEVIQFFESFPNDDFVFYGYGWENGGYRTYGGAPDDKIRTIRHYRFCFCYENIKDIDGYVTEKIFDCFTAGCVPIYWGASNIGAYIPRSCFIDRRDFNSLEELYDFLKNMSAHEYENYLRNIQAYIVSKKAEVYDKPYFDNLLLQAILWAAAS